MNLSVLICLHCKIDETIKKDNYRPISALPQYQKCLRDWKAIDCLNNKSPVVSERALGSNTSTGIMEDFSQ